MHLLLLSLLVSTGVAGDRGRHAPKGELAGGAIQLVDPAAQSALPVVPEPARLSEAEPVATQAATVPATVEAPPATIAEVPPATVPTVIAEVPTEGGCSGCESPGLEEMKAQLEAMSTRLQQLEERIAYGPPLPPGVKAPARPTTSLYGPNGFHLDLSGYFRSRGYVFGAKWGAEKPVTGGLYPEQPTAGKYMTMRLRLGMSLAWKDTASVNIGVQALDNVLWGDNYAKASVPLFAEDPSDTQISGLEAPPIQIFRAWGEVKLPLGVLRVGRQSSMWGMGLLANSGDGFDDDFGENNYGNSFDRFLFATNPVSIIQKFTKKEETQTIPLTLAIAVDRLVEDPLQQYYGYKCSPGVNRDTDPDRYDVRCDSDGDGLTDRDHDYKEDRASSDRSGDWWADGRDDVWEMVYALIYRGTKLDWFGGGDFTAGAYVIHRVQKETQSNVPVADLYVDFKTHGVGFQFEGVGIFGRTKGIALPDSSNPDDPLAKRASIFGYATRLFYEARRYKVLFESGFASGDDNVNNSTFSGRALHPDYNVGLVLYEEVLARVTANLWGENAKGLRSKGGVYDSHYINPRVYLTPMRDVQLIGGFLAALPAKADGAIIRCTDKDVELRGCAVATAKSPILGWETDFGVKARFADHFLFSLETGYAHATDRVSLAAAGLQTNDKGGGNFWTFQSRLAWEL